MTQEKYDLAQYCANILALIDSKEDVGQDRGGALTREYLRSYSELLIIIRGEEDAAARETKLQRAGGTEDSAEVPNGQYQRGRGIRSDPGPKADRNLPRQVPSGSAGD